MKKIITFLLFVVSFAAFAQPSYLVDSMKYVRSGHAIAVLGNNYKILACGGYDQTKNLRTAEIFDTNSNTWLETDSMEYVRYTHTLSNTSFNNDVTIAIGGWDGNVTNHATTEIFDLATETWIAGPTMSVGRSGHTATVLQDGRILIVGGFTGSVNTNVVEIFNPADTTITVLGNLAQGRSYHTATLLNDGKVLVCGGYNPNFGFQLNTAELIDATANTITSVPNMTTARDYHSAVKLGDGKVLVTGGREFVGTGYNGIKSVEVYDPQTNTWESKNDMPGGQSYHEMISGNYYDLNNNAINSVLLVGGVDKSGSHGLDSALTYVYYPQDDLWNAELINNTNGNLHKTGQFESRSISFYNLIGNADLILVTGGSDKSTEIIDFYIWGLKSDKITNTISLSPNPATDKVYFSNLEKKSTIKVYSTEGKLVKDVTLENEINLEIDINELPKGLYLVKVISETNQTTHKLVKE